MQLGYRSWLPLMRESFIQNTHGYCKIISAFYFLEIVVERFIQIIFLTILDFQNLMGYRSYENAALENLLILVYPSCSYKLGLKCFFSIHCFDLIRYLFFYSLGPSCSTYHLHFLVAGWTLPPRSCVGNSLGFHPSNATTWSVELPFDFFSLLSSWLLYP